MLPVGRALDTGYCWTVGCAGLDNAGKVSTKLDTAAGHCERG
jgi:hypothetical protein